MDATRYRTRTRAVLVALGLTIVLLGVPACTLGEPEVPVGEDQVPAPTLPPDEIPTEPPVAEPPVAVTGTVGETVAAGSWRLTVREVEERDRVGDTAAGADLLLEIEVDLANTTAGVLRVSPSDFTLAAGDASLFPLDVGDPGRMPAREYSPGDLEDVKAVFRVPAELAADPLVLVFEPAEGGPARIEIAVR